MTCAWDVQALFHEHVFEHEQAEYAREGLQWVPVRWADNAGTLELIEGRPHGLPGVLHALDDATWRTAEEVRGHASMRARHGHGHGTHPHV